MEECPKCGSKYVKVDAIMVCPECYHIDVDDDKWQGKRSKCPKCKNEVKLFETTNKGHVFHCDHCHTVGNLFHEEDVQKKRYEIQKDSKAGKKLSWLLEVPCDYWTRKEEINTKLKYCKKCELKRVCDEHSKAVEEFCKNKDYEIYISTQFIEIVHK